MTCSPEMCPAGNTHSQWSCGPAPMRSTEARADASRADDDSSTPFGTPVDPEVVTTRAVSSPTGVPPSSGVRPSGVSTESGRIDSSSSRTRASGVPAGTGRRAGPSPSNARAYSSVIRSGDNPTAARSARPPDEGRVRTADGSTLWLTTHARIGPRGPHPAARR